MSGSTELRRLVCSRNGSICPLHIKRWLPSKFFEVWQPDGNLPYASACCMAASPICFKLFAHWTRLAASRAACTAGSNSPTKIPIIAMTTSSSINVIPVRKKTNAWNLELRGEFRMDSFQLGCSRKPHSTRCAKFPPRICILAVPVEHRME